MDQESVVFWKQGDNKHTANPYNIHLKLNSCKNLVCMQLFEVDEIIVHFVWNNLIAEIQ